VVDEATVRCGIYPSISKTGQSILDGFWAIWIRMGIPGHIQIDNTMSFFGSPTHPRGMGPLIRLCLHNDVEPWFIPMSEPWRNGMIENFNDRYQQMFLGKVVMSSQEDLKTGSLIFEQRRSSRYRYSKLGGKTPLKVLPLQTRNCVSRRDFECVGTDAPPQSKTNATAIRPGRRPLSHLTLPILPSL
jgi:putative transposase